MKIIERNSEWWVIDSTGDVEAGPFKSWAEADKWIEGMNHIGEFYNEHS